MKLEIYWFFKNDLLTHRMFHIKDRKYYCKGDNCFPLDHGISNFHIWYFFVVIVIPKNCISRPAIFQCDYDIVMPIFILWNNGKTLIYQAFSYRTPTFRHNNCKRGLVTAQNGTCSISAKLAAYRAGFACWGVSSPIPFSICHTVILSMT